MRRPSSSPDLVLAVALGFVTAVPAARAQVVQPPPSSPPVLRYLELRFPTQGNRGFHDPSTYLRQSDTTHYLSIPGRLRYSLYTEAEPVILADAERFWRSGQFESLWVDVTDSPFENGVVGKHVVFNFVERAETRIPTADNPTTPPEFRQPPAGHQRLYPPPEDRRYR
ncbi:MAG: hypothetical protein CL477_07605 [Acidobacteria bacterium]|jgi:hypothetical protein|nr:hypothetical protein [Acidobacteriota bacterium]MDP7478301.1 hypothetical protein [Vicinamibacterales bacterium]MDP7690610.1 hypothetical protein [Vicinamibacterales bacterium]HJN44924.1 hypothetical protein [Vicinamibacterales bacterium]|tara:strand:+ start:6560 stop:7063 length:504 start_codon:yes stop_codon:yes gene_type:complete